MEYNRNHRESKTGENRHRGFMLLELVVVAAALLLITGYLVRRFQASARDAASLQILDQRTALLRALNLKASSAMAHHGSLSYIQSDAESAALRQCLYPDGGGADCEHIDDLNPPLTRFQDFLLRERDGRIMAGTEFAPAFYTETWKPCTPTATRPCANRAVAKFVATCPAGARPRCATAESLRFVVVLAPNPAAARSGPTGTRAVNPAGFRLHPDLSALPSVPAAAIVTASLPPCQRPGDCTASTGTGAGGAGGSSTACPNNMVQYGVSSTGSPLCRARTRCRTVKAHDPNPAGSPQGATAFCAAHEQAIGGGGWCNSGNLLRINENRPVPGGWKMVCKHKLNAWIQSVAYAICCE